MFASNVVNTYTCLGNCGKERRINEHYNHFSIAESSDITVALSDFFKPSNDALLSTCETCKCDRSSHTLLCTKWPKVLVLQIKRFECNKDGKATKSSRSVFVPYMFKPGSASVDKIYNLTGIIHHMGSSPSSGHYTADVLRNGSWYRCNDSVIAEVDLQSEYSANASGLHTKSAYILMFEALS